MENETGIYIFCAIQTNEEHDFGTIDFEGKTRKVYTIHYKDAAMVAAEMPMKIYHPSKENLMMHQNVISDVMKKMDTVVPISFGNVFNSKEDVIALSESLYPQFEELFPKIKGKIELGLKVIGKKEWLQKEINKDPEVTKQKQTVNKKTEAAGYFDRIELGEMASKFFQSLQQDIEKEIHEELKNIAVAAEVNEPIGEKMLLNGAYLIDSNQEEKFDEKVNELHDKWKDKVDFKYTGPWPAYNFINIKLKVEENA